MNKKKLIILISIIIALAVLACVGIFALSGKGGTSVADKLDMGEKYLAELEYEKALAVYKEILAIDPKNVDAYVGIVDTYMAMGDYEKALEYAKVGFEETGAQELKNLIASIEDKMKEEKGSPSEEDMVPSVDEEADEPQEKLPAEEESALMEGTKALEIKVPENYNVMQSNGGVLIIEQNGLYGAANYDGEIIVPATYAHFTLTPGNEGYFVLSEIDGEYSTAYVFDDSGDIRMSIEGLTSVRVWGHRVIYSTKNISAETGNVVRMLAIEDLAEGRTLYMAKDEVYFDDPSASLIPQISEDGKFYYSDGQTWCTYRVDENGIQYEWPCPRLNSNFSDGYAIKLNNSYMAYTIGLTNEDGTDTYSIYPEQIWEGYYSELGIDGKMKPLNLPYYFDGGMYKHNKGKQFVLWRESPKDGSISYYLLDMLYAQRGEWLDSYDSVTNVNETIVAVYDYIGMSDSPYYLAGKDGKWFYIDATGKIVHDSYLDYSVFYGGYAMIIDTDGCAYMIDEQFNKVAGGYEATGVYTAGGIFCIDQPDGTVYLAPPTP